MEKLTKIFTLPVASAPELQPRVSRAGSWDGQMGIRTDGCKVWGEAGMKKRREDQEQTGFCENELETSRTTWNPHGSLTSSKFPTCRWFAEECGDLYHGAK